MSLTPGAKLGPYTIESQIGAGAMGEVYKAHDARLNRPVAIKLVTADRAQRFRTEARAIAALNHPHICQIYDIGPDYLVLEYLPGETLRGPVSPDVAVSLAIQMADALATAHDRGILHRDLKPGNIIVTHRGGATTAKLLDFGIARFTDSGADATRTAAGAVIGTPAYMSPEQAQGKPLDVRSDIFSFGAVLYELLSGNRAFQGEAMIQVLVAVVQKEPETLTAPAPLQRIVTRCLAKDPAQRFQTMREVKQALATVTVEAGDLPQSIAVLPFANLSGDRENEYFGDGLAEEIINTLANVPGLKVIARTSAFSFKGRNEDVRSIARALGVTNVLEGSVRRSGDRVRITAQLITASDGSHLWSERFDRPVRDVFEMQDEMAQAITSALKGRLATPASAARPQAPSLTAYETLLRGRAHLIQFTPDGWRRAQAHFEHAASIDPGYADPHTELAVGYFISGMHSVQPMRDVAPLVRAEAHKAMELNPADTRPRFILGGIALAHDYDWDTAREHLEASRSAGNPSAYARWIYASLYLRGLGRYQESAAEMSRVVEMDPLNATWHAILSAHLVGAGRFAEAVEAAERAMALEPTFVIAQHLAGEAYWHTGRRDDAIALWERVLTGAPWPGFTHGWLAAAYRMRGDTARANEVAALLDHPATAVWTRVVYAVLTGDADGAVRAFEEMIDRRDPFTLIYVHSPFLQIVRDHERWPAIAAAMNLPSR